MDQHKQDEKAIMTVFGWGMLISAGVWLWLGVIPALITAGFFSMLSLLMAGIHISRSVHR
jgi:hypothetical protein